MCVSRVEDLRPGKGGHRPATEEKLKVQFDKGNQDKADQVWPRMGPHATRPNQRKE
jgi:hypothetical protein